MAIAMAAFIVALLEQPLGATEQSQGIFVAIPAVEELCGVQDMLLRPPVLVSQVFDIQEGNVLNHPVSVRHSVHLHIQAYEGIGGFRYVLICRADEISVAFYCLEEEIFGGPILALVAVGLGRVKQGEEVAPCEPLPT
jgi:hypothetical protein